MFYRNKSYAGVIKIFFLGNPLISNNILLNYFALPYFFLIMHVFSAIFAVKYCYVVRDVRRNFGTGQLYLNANCQVTMDRLEFLRCGTSQYLAYDERLVPRCI